MAVDHAHGAVLAHDDENLDHQGNANLAVWLGLMALTFMTASFVGSNVYLRGWNPGKFVLKSKELSDLPYFYTLFLLIAGILVLVAGALFVKNRWKAFNGVLAIAAIFFVAVMITEFQLMLWFSNYSKQIATIYTPTLVIQLILSIICVILVIIAGWYASFANKKKLNSFFPVAMNVWIYTVLSSIVILLMEDVMTFGQFAAWCGQHLT